jgi:hypothetical protein
LALSPFFFVAALFVSWRCLAVGFAKPVPAIIMVLTAALLTGMGWLVRQFSAARRPIIALARNSSLSSRARAIPKIESSEPSEPAADVVQQLTLRTTTDGGQELSGWLRMNLSTGQRTGTLHVAFCPPFDQPPAVEAEAVAGPDCRIKVDEVMPYGVRLDIKLDAPAENDENVLVSFFAASGSK